MTNSEFTQLLKPHYNHAVNYCRALCAGEDQVETEEILQQSLLKAFENVDSLKNPESFKSWLFQIITNSYYNAIRRPFWKRFVSQSTLNESSDFQIYAANFFDENQELIIALSQIDIKERAAILLFEIGGFSIKEITVIQNEKSESAIKSRLSRTRAKLKEIMEKLESENPPPSNIKSLKTSDLYHETSELINQYKSMGG